MTYASRQHQGRRDCLLIAISIQHMRLSITLAPFVMIQMPWHDSETANLSASRSTIRLGRGLALSESRKAV